MKQSNESYNKILKEFKSLYNDIKEGKLILKKGAHLTKENLEMLDVYGMRKSNNTSFNDMNDNEIENNMNYTQNEVDNGEIQEDEEKWCPS